MGEGWAPETIYHVTSAANAEAILRDGFAPPTKLPKKLAKFYTAGQGIYLFDDLDTARRWETDSYLTEGPTAILAVHPSEEDLANGLTFVTGDWGGARLLRFIDDYGEFWLYRPAEGEYWKPRREITERSD